MEERRLASMEFIISELATVKQLGTDTKEKVEDLIEHVAIQNGRMNKLEQWKSYLVGATTVLTLLVIPVALRFTGVWFSTLIKANGN